VQLQPNLERTPSTLASGHQDLNLAPAALEALISNRVCTPAKPGRWGLGLMAAIGVVSGPVLWPSADPIPHVFDVAGPRSDGRLVVAAGGKLFVLNQATGVQERFAGGPGGYPGAGHEEPYIAVVPATVASQTTFRLDEVFVLQLKPTGAS